MTPPFEDKDILDVEDFREENQEFSHQSLVMKSFNKVIELGSKELIEGFYDEEQKGRDGVTKVIYKEDTRRAFIEGVKSLKMVMICDFDEEAIKKTNKIVEDIKKLRKEHLKNQLEYWNKLKYNEKQYLLSKIKTPPNDKYFHNQLFFRDLFIEEELDKYREIVEELSLLSKRLDFYASSFNVV